MHTHEDEEESIDPHLYCRLFVQWGRWFALDDLYGRYYTVTRGGVGHGRLDSDKDADADEEGEARDGGDVG